MHIKKPKGSPMLSVIDSNVKHKSHGHGHMGNGGVLHNGMSLFQDLKLKRRKVDSRCSSDGESIGTSDSAASLSPDAQPTSEGSPKEKDRCVSPEEMGAPANGGKAHAFLFMMKAKEAYEGPKSNGVIKALNGAGRDLVIVKSEPSDEELVMNESGCQQPEPISERHQQPIPDRHQEPIPERHQQPITDRHQQPITERRKSPAARSSSSNAGSDTDSTSSSLKREGAKGRSPPPLVSRPHSTPGSPPGGGGSNHSNSSTTSGVVCSPQSSSSPSPSTLTISKGGGSPPGGPPPSHYLNNYRELLLGTHSHLHARLTVPNRVASPEKPDPLSVVTSTSLSFHHGSVYRINGVRPEVISGGAVTPVSSPGAQSPHPLQGMRKSPNHSLSSRSPNASPASNSSSQSQGPGHSPNSGLMPGGGATNSHHHHANLNRTPTVIMGEAGGVRTMLWSQPGQGLPSELGGPSPPAPNGMGMGQHYGQQAQQNGTPAPSPPHNNNIHLLHQKGGLSMERLWASEALNLSTSGVGGSNTTNGHSAGQTNGNGHGGHFPGAGQNGHSGLSLNGHHITNSHPDDEDFEQPMICMICEDRATGLHYGIITCEGCKGFFKRTVQNRRVYTCVADGTCEITKAQRNRCQYCRFKKCIEQGMVLQAVREDRMPGGRNSGAVYNLYKVPVKYRKHKKANRAGGGKNEKLTNGSNGSINGSNGPNNHSSSPLHLPPNNGLSNGMSQQQQPSHGPPQPQQPSNMGTILKAALTSPNEVNHLRQGIPFDQAAGMITHLVQCDNFHDIAALQNWEELLEARGDLSDKLCQMGDSIVYRLVQWTKRLPFYQEVPVEVHTRVLTHKWHELLVLTTSAWQAMHTPGPPTALTAEEETMENLQVLQRCLQAMMGRSLTLEQLRQDVGQMVERLTYLTRSFRRLGIRIEEYVTLKVIAMLQNTGTKSNEVAVIQERYIKCLRTFLEVTCPSHPNRLSDLLRTLPEVQAAAALLLESKMFYVPFLLNSALLQR